MYLVRFKNEQYPEGGTEKGVGSANGTGCQLVGAISFSVMGLRPGDPPTGTSPVHPVLV